MSNIFAVRMMRERNKDPGSPVIATVQDIDFPSLEAVEEALASPVPIDGRFYHVVFEHLPVN